MWNYPLSFQRKMTKDRLQEMKTLMQEEDVRDERESKPQEKSTALITFFEHAITVRLEVQNLRQRVNNIKILLSDNQDWRNSSSREKIEQKMEEQKLIVGNLARAIRNNVKSMKNTRWDSKSTSVIQRIKEVQLSAIINELNEILRDYLQCLIHHRERSEKILKDMLEVKGEGIKDIATLLEEGKTAIFSNNLLVGEMEEKLKLREVEEERIGIIKIESSILEIRNLFNELALIVDLQAEKVEEVEKLVEKNLNKVESGKAQLTSASKKKGKLRYKKLMIALICGSIILIVLVIITII